jgi:hypothetical protein
MRIRSVVGHELPKPYKQNVSTTTAAKPSTTDIKQATIFLAYFVGFRFYNRLKKPRD